LVLFGLKVSEGFLWHDATDSHLADLLAYLPPGGLDGCVQNGGDVEAGR